MKKINKVLIIGSGPIVIGQAAEFDYSGTQACLALKEQGVKTVVINPNPATIQTDKEVADKIYFEPLTVPSIEKIIAKEKPDGLIATVGGQIALNLATQLFIKGILKKYKVQILGTDIEAITNGENRIKFANKMKSIGQPVLPSKGIKTVKEASGFAQKIGYPLIIRSAYTLGGAGSSVVYNDCELNEKITNGLNTSPINEVLIEKSVIGWGEFEYEIVRDGDGNCICICNMENINPMGVHTGDSIVIAPSQTLSDDEHQMLRNAAFKIVESLNIKGGCNVQFALNQKTGKYFVIEVNPRLSRSSALASKATGYPIAKIATKIALGHSLPEIKNDITGKTAFFEPSLDFVVIKIPKWPFDKFPDLNNQIGISMKSTGEIMAIGKSFEEALLKGLDSLDGKENILSFDSAFSKTEILQKLTIQSDDLLKWLIFAFKKGVLIDEVYTATGIQKWFLRKINNLATYSYLRKSKTIFKMVDTCSGEFPALTPYFYSTVGMENEAVPLPGPKVIILGSGPIRIGQGIEFDYMTVHAVKALKEMGIKSIIINNNPETVSTDYSISDRLYFEPLSLKYVSDILNNEKEGLLGIICQFGGQTALNLVSALEAKGYKILGTNNNAVTKAEDRKTCSTELIKLGLSIPQWTYTNSKKDILSKCDEIGFPLIVRPSYVLAGEGMAIIKNKKDVKNYLKLLNKEVFEKPLLIDKFINHGKEVDIDFISDGETVIAFVLEQLEPTGIHSGDSSCVYPAVNLDKKTISKLENIARKIALDFKIIGLGNIQAAIKDGEIYILEVNPRASRTIPFLCKSLGISLVNLATRVILGAKINKKDFYVVSNKFAVKKPIFSFYKLPDLSKQLGPIMKSTGEVMATGDTFYDALIKASFEAEATSGFSN